MLAVHNLAIHIKLLYMHAEMNIVVWYELKSVRRLGHRTDLYTTAGMILSAAESGDVVLYAHNKADRSQLLMRK